MKFYCHKCNIDFTAKDEEHFRHDNYSFKFDKPVNLTTDLIDFFISEQQNPKDVK